MEEINHVAVLDFGSQYTQLIVRRVRELGCFAKLYHPEHLDEIFMGVQQYHSKSNSAETDGSLTVASNSMAYQSSNITTTEALDHLQKQARSNGSMPKPPGRSVVTSLATKKTGSRS